ncbi:MAG TPA: hypothetical protein VEK36_02250 [Candidatus Paceibacterota bacterium]|nr:hypothetical protein [Candidatus Paceibacterota bacterium]
MNNRQKFWSVFPMLVAAGLVIWGLLWYAGNFQSNKATQEELLEGTVTYVDTGGRVIILNNMKGKAVSLAIVPQTKVYDEGGRTVGVSYVHLGSAVQAKGIYIALDTFAPSSIHIIRR